MIQGTATLSTAFGRAAATAAGVAILAVVTACASAPTGGEATPRAQATVSECIPAPDGEEDATLVTIDRIPGFTSQARHQDLEFICLEVPVAPELAWGVLPGIYQSLGIPVVNTDPAKMLVGNPGFEVQRIDGARMNRWLDCGTSRTGPMANAYQVTLTVQTELSEVAEGTTEVKSLVTGQALNRSTAGFTVSCETRETLEELIADKIAETLGIG